MQTRYNIVLHKVQIFLIRNSLVLDSLSSLRMLPYQILLVSSHNLEIFMPMLNLSLPIISFF